MRKRIKLNQIIAERTNDPSEIVRMIDEAEKIDLPNELYALATDISRTVKSNIPKLTMEATVAGYLLRLAYVLNREGRLLQKHDDIF